MSHSLEPFQPPSEISGPAADDQRPIGVTVFAILNLIFGSMGVIGIVMSAIMMAAGGNLAGAQNPAIDMLDKSTLYFVYFVVALILGLLFSILLIVSGVGLLKMSPRARQFAIAYAVYSIVSGIIGTAVNYFVVFAPMLEQASQAAGPQQLAATFGVVVGLIGSLLGLIFPVAILIYFFRPKVKEAFAK